MKNKKISIIVMLGLLILAGQFCVVQSGSSAAQDRALAFIEDVLPIDSSKFFIELKSDSVPDKPVFFTEKNISFGGNGDQVLVYFLASKMGTMDSLNVILAIKNNVVYQFAVGNLATGPNVGQSSLNEAANIFLTRYQEYSELDSTEMINILSNFDLAQNTQITLGNLTMTLNRMDTSMEIRWVFPDARAFNVSFQNNFPVSFYDERQIPSTTPTPTQLPTINTDPEPPQTESFLATLVIGAAIVVAVVSLGLLVYHKNTKEIGILEKKNVSINSHLCTICFISCWSAVCRVVLKNYYCS